jgi:hypothetical protein
MEDPVSPLLAAQSILCLPSQKAEAASERNQGRHGHETPVTAIKYKTPRTVRAMSPVWGVLILL